MHESSTNSTNTAAIVGSLVRHTAGAGGAATAVASHDDLLQILGALATLLSVAWGIYEKLHRPPPPAVVAGLILAACGLGGGGCASMTEAQKLSLIQTVSSEAAYVGCAVDLGDNPTHRAGYVAAVAALEAIIARDAYDPENLRAALNGLPQLRGASGAIIESGVVLYSVGTGFIDLAGAPAVRAAVTGIHAGLKRALARPTGTATRAFAGPLPAQCTVPPRR
jgi:hypothetical protein